MEYNNLKILADKFWNGECSEAEEKLLRDALRWDENLPEEFSALKDYLAVMNAEPSSLSDEFDDKILSIIDGKPKKVFSLKRLYPLVAAAVVLFGVFIATQNTDPISPVHVAEVITEDTYEDPEKALEEVKKALLLVSSKMNKGKTYSKELGNFSIAADHLQPNKDK